MLKRTPLYESHIALGAKMVDFAGWEMPIQYQGIGAEHVAVRQQSGLFDVSHMGEISLKGPQAETFLNFVALNDASKLAIGRGHYSMLPNQQGGLIDDIYLYREAEDAFLMVCNASNREVVISHLQELAQGYHLKLSDDSDAWALIALQGPESPKQLQTILNTDLTRLKKNQYLEVDFERGLRIARTGYTGEAWGYEIFVRPEDALKLWQALLEQGATPCGLGARDTLRLEAGFPLFGHEFNASTNPLCSDYAWVVKDKTFYGREAMWGAACDKRLVGILLEDKGIPREGYKLFKEGEEVGQLSSGTLSPSSKKGIGMTWLKAELAKVGESLELEIRNKRLAAKVTKTPFE
ncbi:MAG: glycine cleavage system aminomethyltransferase GcvT [Deinococcales bacterium]